MHLARFPRHPLSHNMTPLEPLPRLSRALGGPNLYIKRDDCTGLATGGNKTRKLEFLVGDALAQGCDTLITTGALQSNHARQTAAAAARVGLACDLVLAASVEGRGDLYAETGNMLLDDLLGARVHVHPRGTDMEAAMADVAEAVRSRGGKPYVIPSGGSSPVGALGYANCAMELLTQSLKQGLRIDHVIHATGSGGTQAGLLAGLEATHSGIPVLGISVNKPRDVQEPEVHALARQVGELVGLPGGVARDRVHTDDRFYGPAYGQPTPEMVEAVRLTAREEGLVLDPVYTGKAMAGLVGLVREGRFRAGENVVFVHTGGQVGLFAYHRVFTDGA